VVEEEKDDHCVEALDSTDITYLIKPVGSWNFGADLIAVKPEVELD